MHKITAGLDEGDILLSRRLEVTPDENLRTLTDKLCALLPGMVSRLVADLPTLWANAAPQDPGNENGWNSNSRNNRYAIISEINNQTYHPLHQFLYEYHRSGLDNMAEHPDQAREAVLSALQQLRSVYERNSMCYFLQLLIESKRDEIIQVFSQGEQRVRVEAANIMKTIDPSQSSRYDSMLQNKGY